jgi:hypothetical protein
VVVTENPLRTGASLAALVLGAIAAWLSTLVIGAHFVVFAIVLAAEESLSRQRVALLLALFSMLIGGRVAPTSAPRRSA